MLCTLPSFPCFVGFAVSVRAFVFLPWLFQERVTELKHEY